MCLLLWSQNSCILGELKYPCQIFANNIKQQIYIDFSNVYRLCLLKLNDSNNYLMYCCLKICLHIVLGLWVILFNISFEYGNRSQVLLVGLFMSSYIYLYVSSYLNCLLAHVSSFSFIPTVAIRSLLVQENSDFIEND